MRLILDFPGTYIVCETYKLCTKAQMHSLLAIEGTLKFTYILTVWGGPSRGISHLLWEARGRGFGYRSLRS